MKWHADKWRSDRGLLKYALYMAHNVAVIYRENIRLKVKVICQQKPKRKLKELRLGVCKWKCASLNTEDSHSTKVWAGNHQRMEITSYQATLYWNGLLKYHYESLMLSKSRQGKVKMKKKYKKNIRIVAKEKRSKMERETVCRKVSSLCFQKQQERDTG